MEISVTKVSSLQIQSLRNLFLHEGSFQFIYNKCHLYGWADTYAFTIDDITVGYGAIWGKDKREDRDAIFEFYIIQPYRKFTNQVFKKLHVESGATFIECQTNDVQLCSLLYEYAGNITAEAILFKDVFQTEFSIPQVNFEKNATANNNPNDCAYILKLNNETVVTGGLMLNYNFPYADVYYEVKENYRRKGYGSFMLQQLKKEAYKMQRVPAARCNIKNVISKSALTKAGFAVCGFILTGKIIKSKEL